MLCHQWQLYLGVSLPLHLIAFDFGPFCRPNVEVKHLFCSWYWPDNSGKMTPVLRILQLIGTITTTDDSAPKAWRTILYHWISAPTRILEGNRQNCLTSSCSHGHTLAWNLQMMMIMHDNDDIYDSEHRWKLTWLETHFGITINIKNYFALLPIKINQSSSIFKMFSNRMAKWQILTQHEASSQLRFPLFLSFFFSFFLSLSFFFFFLFLSLFFYGGVGPLAPGCATVRVYFKSHYRKLQMTWHEDVI